MERKLSLLICDDDPTFPKAVQFTLKSAAEIHSAKNCDEALAILKNRSIDLLFLDIEMRTNDEGLRYIPRFREMDPDLAIVMNSSRTDFATVREAMRLGAIDYVPKDFNSDELPLVIERALGRRKIRQRSHQQGDEAFHAHRRRALVGSSPAMVQLRAKIEKIRHSQASVVITGETGTGKEVVARQLRGIDEEGALLPFVSIDSSTIQQSMAESMLFGHEKGAFTGADKMARGVFEEANGGIVYFDEIGNMPLDIQAKLLRVLQEKEVTRLGSNKAMPLEFRVVCATNRDLEALCAAGQFKADLWQRLNVLPISIPPLRDRPEDIPELVAHFSKSLLTFTPEAIATLKKYSWPGNVRELGNLVAYLHTMADSPEIDHADLPPRIRDAERKALSGSSFYERVEEFERGVLAQEYGLCEGNVSRLATKLGMDRSHLHSKLKALGIHSIKRDP